MSFMPAWRCIVYDKRNADASLMTNVMQLSLFCHGGDMPPIRGESQRLCMEFERHGSQAEVEVGGIQKDFVC